MFRGVPGAPGRPGARPNGLVPRAETFFWTVIWTTEGLTNSATPTKASDRARAVFWLSAVNCGAAGAVRSIPRELTRAAVATTRAAQETAFLFMALTSPRKTRSGRHIDDRHPRPTGESRAHRRAVLFSFTNRRRRRF